MNENVKNKKQKEVSSRGAIKIDCPHCNKRILVRKQYDGNSSFGKSKYKYLVARYNKWIPAKEEDR